MGAPPTGPPATDLWAGHLKLGKNPECKPLEGHWVSEDPASGGHGIHCCLCLAGASPTPAMALSWKERVFMALLGTATASGLTVLVLILVEATNILLPADTKVPGLGRAARGRLAGASACPTLLTRVSPPVWDRARCWLFPHLSLCVPVASGQGEGHGFGQPGPGLPGERSVGFSHLVLDLPWRNSSWGRGTGSSGSA